MKLIKNYIIWKLYNLFNRYCKFHLNLLIPGISLVIDKYKNKTETTGTNYSNLHEAVKTILKKKPKWILESGTGTSTLVFAETILQMQKKDPNYHCRIVSMESTKKWYEMAKNLLPKKYSNIVEIRFGPRKIFEYSMFRGYVHTNIPNYAYEFVFLDGPDYTDEFGTSTCMDAIYVRLQSQLLLVSCVISTRVTSVWMMQQIFGNKLIKYFPYYRTCSVDMPPIETNPQLNSESFSSNLLGKLRPNKLTKNN